RLSASHSTIRNGAISQRIVRIIASTSKRLAAKHSDEPPRVVRPPLVAESSLGWASSEIVSGELRRAPIMVRASGRKMAVRGGLNHRAIAQVLNRHREELNRCYLRADIDTGAMGGEARIQWSIGSGGKVVRARVKSSSLASPAVERCL